MSWRAQSSHPVFSPLSNGRYLDSAPEAGAPLVMTTRVYSWSEAPDYLGKGYKFQNTHISNCARCGAPNQIVRRVILQRCHGERSPAERDGVELPFVFSAVEQKVSRLSAKNGRFARHDNAGV